MEPAFWVFCGTLIGGAVSVLTTWFNNTNALQIHRLKSRDERDEKAREFQRETLLATQEAAQNLLRLMARAHIADINAFRSGQAWELNRLEPPLNEDMRAANGRMALLTERIADDTLRDAIQAFQSSINSVVNATSANSAEEALEKVSFAIPVAMGQIGAALRTHY